MWATYVNIIPCHTDSLRDLNCKSFEHNRHIPYHERMVKAVYNLFLRISEKPKLKQNIKGKQINFLTKYISVSLYKPKVLCN